MIETLGGSGAAIPEGQRRKDERPGARRRPVGSHRRAREEDGEAGAPRAERPTSPAPKKAQTLKELSKHTENARKDYDRGVAALQKKKLEEAERHFLDLIQKYPEEKELVDRARVYLTVCERQRRDPRPALTEPEDFYYAAVLEKNRGNVAEAIEHLQRARQEERRREGRLPPRVLLRAEGRPRDRGRRISRRRSRRTSGIGSSRATTATSIRCARRRSSRSCSRRRRRRPSGAGRRLLYCWHEVRARRRAAPVLQPSRPSRAPRVVDPRGGSRDRACAPPCRRCCTASAGRTLHRGGPRVGRGPCLRRAWSWSSAPAASGSRSRSRAGP